MQQPIQDAKLAEAVKRLVEGLHPRAIILFGSRARGTNRDGSDYDLLVVSERLLDYDEVYRPWRAAGCGATSFLARWMHGARLIWTRAAYFTTRSKRVLCFMANPRRVRALLEMADEDLSGAKALLGISTRLARYHVQQGAEKAVKALLEQR